MSPIDPNVELLELAAARLASLLDELTLVGACAASVLITDSAAKRPRPTFDVDFIVEATTYASYQAFGKRLAALGFEPSTARGDPICRWRVGGLQLDIMPLDREALGFAGTWYAAAVRSRGASRLPSGRMIHHVDAPHFLATKLEAFRSGERGDVVSSKDLEDLVLVVD